MNTMNDKPSTADPLSRTQAEILNAVIRGLGAISQIELGHDGRFVCFTWKGDQWRVDHNLRVSQLRNGCESFDRATDLMARLLLMAERS